MLHALCFSEGRLCKPSSAPPLLGKTQVAGENQTTFGIVTRFWLGNQASVNAATARMARSLPSAAQQIHAKIARSAKVFAFRNHYEIARGRGVFAGCENL